ncbi:MAG: WG repeat-containing protein [Clostridia bacterium]|nr:WG repeat-containing protein [Clostridia bacterium]
MTLVDENELIYEQEKRRKIFSFLIKAIVILVVICIVLVICRNVVKAKTLKCYVDDKKIEKISDDFLLKDDKGRVLVENGNVYVSIRQLSTLLNRQFYNSEYKKKGEDKTKCQIKVDNIYTSFIANSNKVYKAIELNEDETKDAKKQKSTSEDGFEEIEEAPKVDFEYFTIGDSIRLVNNELYGSTEAINLGFDVAMSYNQKNNTLSIYSLDQLENRAKKLRADMVSSSEYNYRNKRLLKYGMVIVKDADGNLGVASYTDANKESSYVASCKYSEIEFNEGTNTFYVITSNDSQKGILYVNTKNQEVEKNMNTQYEDIKVATNDFNYFIVKQSSKYGVIDNEGKIVIPIQFDEIGVKEESYSDLTCKYILNNKYVPVKSNGMWGLYSIDGNKLIEPQYADIGCNLAQSGDSTVIVPGLKDDITGVVFLYNREKGFYGVYNADTGERIAVSLTEVFKKIENDEENYYVNHIIDRATSKVHTLNLRKDI